MYGLLFLTPLYLQTVHHAGALVAGLELMPMSLTFFAVSTFSGKLTKAYGPRAMMVAGTACMGLGEIAFGWLAPEALFLSLAAVLIGCGGGLVSTTAPLSAAAVGSVPPARAGTASGLINTARMVGATLGVAVLGAVYAAYTGSAAGNEAVAHGLGAAF